MPRENEGFRENLLRLDEKFPNKELLRKVEVSRFAGVKYETVSKLFTFNKCNMISKVTLARELS